MKHPEILIVAGEVSGDIHGGNLLRELIRIVPEIRAFGVGGDRLLSAGLDQVATTEDLAHMGLVEVLNELPRIRRVMLDLVGEVEKRRPDLAVLIDSPDFNLRLAKRLRRRGVPVVLYVSPQLWAWRSGRVRQVRRLAEEVLCILPFEVPFYEERGVGARYVGHPLVDEIARVGLLEQPKTPVDGRLGLLPGSRAMEVRQLLPVMLRALERMPVEQVNDAVLVEAPGMAQAIDTVLDQCGSDRRMRRITGESRRRELAASSLAWTASGTATLECALLGVPMVVGYRLQALSFAIARLLVRVPNAALVNLIAGSTIAPELLQKAWEPQRLASISTVLLADGAELQRAKLVEVRERLGSPGASRRAAEAVAEHLDR
ncbi:MAG: lipid-A-disaccharide synthase [Acidobacteria bacterium]|nr:lipid-A-disaccharide synthase [Acidobacteriota bacterium]